MGIKYSESDLSLIYIFIQMRGRNRYIPLSFRGNTDKTREFQKAHLKISDISFLVRIVEFYVYGFFFLLNLPELQTHLSFFSKVWIPCEIFNKKERELKEILMIRKWSSARNTRSTCKAKGRSYLGLASRSLRRSWRNAAEIFSPEMTLIIMPYMIPEHALTIAQVQI